MDYATEHLSLEQAKPLLAAAFHDREAAFERLRLVGSDDSIEAARVWVRSIYRLRKYLDGESPSMDGWKDLVREVNAGRDAFFALIRGELGVHAANRRR